MARVTDRRIKRQRHADGALAIGCLKRLGDRDPIDRKMIEREFVLRIERDARVVREGGAF